MIYSTLGLTTTDTLPTTFVTSTSITNPNTSSQSASPTVTILHKGKNTTAIVVGVVVPIVTLACIGLGIILCLRRRKVDHETNKPPPELTEWVKPTDSTSQVDPRAQVAPPTLISETPGPPPIPPKSPFRMAASPPPRPRRPESLTVDVLESMRSTPTMVDPYTEDDGLDMHEVERPVRTVFPPAEQGLTPEPLRVLRPDSGGLSREKNRVSLERSSHKLDHNLRQSRANRPRTFMSDPLRTSTYDEDTAGPSEPFHNPYEFDLDKDEPDDLKRTLERAQTLAQLEDTPTRVSGSFSAPTNESTKARAEQSTSDEAPQVFDPAAARCMRVLAESRKHGVFGAIA